MNIFKAIFITTSIVNFSIVANTPNGKLQEDLAQTEKDLNFHKKHLEEMYQNFNNPAPSISDKDLYIEELKEAIAYTKHQINKLEQDFIRIKNEIKKHSSNQRPSNLNFNYFNREKSQLLEKNNSSSSNFKKSQENDDDENDLDLKKITPIAPPLQFFPQDETTSDKRIATHDKTTNNHDLFLSNKKQQYSIINEKTSSKKNISCKSKP